MALLAILFALFLVALGVFLFLLPAKLLVVVAWTSHPDVREKVVADAEQWYVFAKIGAVLVPFGVIYFMMESIT